MSQKRPRLRYGAAATCDRAAASQHEQAFVVCIVLLSTVLTQLGQPCVVVEGVIDSRESLVLFWMFVGDIMSARLALSASTICAIAWIDGISTKRNFSACEDSGIVDGTVNLRSRKCCGV